MNNPTRHPLYSIWNSMKQRCLNPNNRAYPNYGGRGITVCKRWIDSFDSFVSDMGERPNGYLIDRIDNDGPYSPSNCRWTDRKTQQRNQRRTRLVTIGGATHKAADLAETAGVKVDTVVSRAKRGLPLEQVMADAKQVNRRKPVEAIAARINAQSRHCKNGHLRTPENTLINVHGHHSCRICNRERVKRQRIT